MAKRSDRRRVEAKLPDGRTLKVEAKLSDGATLSWDHVPGAIGYNIYALTRWERFDFTSVDAPALGAPTGVLTVSRWRRRVWPG